MKYENFERAQSICAKIKERQNLASRIESCDEVLFRYASGSHVLTIEIDKKYPSPDFHLNRLAKTFRRECLSIIKHQMDELHIELEEL